MGSALSSYKSKRRDKKEYKRKLREQLKEAQEHIARLQEQLQCENELLEAFQRSRIAPNVGPGTQKYQAATEMMKEIDALERKLFFEQVALNVTENRCDFLDNNYRLLHDNETNLYWQKSSCQTNLEALKKKQEAIQFSRFKDENPLEQWVVCSLPNLYFGRVETLSSWH
nr:neuron navigator 3-like [Pocillopora verrucosa]